MANFKIAYPLSAANEGGYVNDPDDFGKETYCGISRRYFPSWEGWAYVDKYKPLKKGEKLKNDTFITPNGEGIEDLVMDFYKKNFWDKVHGDDFADQTLANKTYDCAINKGVSEGISELQASIGVAITGKMTTETIKSIKNEDIL